MQPAAAPNDAQFAINLPDAEAEMWRESEQVNAKK